jgi:hypothetical protein
MPFITTSVGGDGSGLPGPQGEPGNNGLDGAGFDPQPLVKSNLDPGVGQSMTLVGPDNPFLGAWSVGSYVRVINSVNTQEFFEGTITQFTPGGVTVTILISYVTATWTREGNTDVWTMTLAGARGNANTGDITFEGNSIIGDGTMNLVPNADLLTNEYSQTQYLIIDPTAPNHIHIRAGGNIDESTAELIFGGERNKVSVSDSYKSVAITTAEIITNTYVNAHEANNEDLIVPEESDILIGDNIVIAGINHPVTYFSPDPNNTGFSIVRATGATFIAGESYTFVRDQGNNNQWTFGYGELSFPNGSSMETEMDAGHLIISTAPSSINNGGNIELNAGYTLGENKSGGSVSISAGAAGAGSAGGSVYISTTDTGRILLVGDGGEFLNNMNTPSNQIATLGDIGIETDYTVVGGTAGTQPTFNGNPLFAGSYIKTAGNLVNFRVTVDFDNITSFGSGQYYVTLPFPAKYDYSFREGNLWDSSDSKSYSISGHVVAGSSVMELSSMDAQSGTVFDIPFSSAGPITLNVADDFHISGTYVMQDLP